MTQVGPDVLPGDSSGSHVLQLVGSGQRVLELGCGRGEQALRFKQQGCAVVGVEPDPSAAAEATAIADRVLVLDPDASDPLAPLRGEHFDVVVVGQLLGRIDNADAILRAARDLLGSGGYLVATVPNVAHGAVRLALAQGRFPYAEGGLLDRAQLRHFTRSSLLELLAGAGWEVVRVDEIRRGVLDTEVPLDEDLIDNDLLAVVQRDPEAQVYWLVAAARPATADWDVALPAVGAIRTGVTRAREAEESLPPSGGSPVAGVRAFAFYLPQFHPTPENDIWWGKGFTEWTNVARARPRFSGHRQPNLPADLGFYDLRLPEVRHAQAELAAAHGIEGFVYYHYWFGARRLLEGPLASVLESGEPDYPFALLWANESWSRQWDGRDLELLVEQTYPDGDVQRHAAYLAQVFADHRYLRVGGAPWFAIYRTDNLPGEPRAYVESLRDALAKEGVDRMHLVRAETGRHVCPPEDLGFDAELEFHPHRLHELAEPVVDPYGRYRGAKVYDYIEVAAGHIRRPAVPWTRYACVVPHWDNSPRRAPDRATFLVGSTPERYERWLRGVAEREAGPRGSGMVFVNAWNEWAEGAYLEPDQRHGRAYLEATRSVLGPRPPVPPPVGRAGWVRDDLADRVAALQREVSDAYERGEATARGEIEELRRRLEEVERESEARKGVIADIGAWARSQEVARMTAEGHYHDLEEAYRRLEAAYARLQTPPG